MKAFNTVLLSVLIAFGFEFTDRCMTRKHERHLRAVALAEVLLKLEYGSVNQDTLVINKVNELLEDLK